MCGILQGRDQVCHMSGIRTQKALYGAECGHPVLSAGWRLLMVDLPCFTVASPDCRKRGWAHMLQIRVLQKLFLNGELVLLDPLVFRHLYKTTSNCWSLNSIPRILSGTRYFSLSVGWRLQGCVNYRSGGTILIVWLVQIDGHVFASVAVPVDKSVLGILSVHNSKHLPTSG